jgi:hypothetical protein
MCKNICKNICKFKNTYVSLQRQTIRISNNIKQINSMKALNKQQEVQVYYEWCYNNYEVRTKLELKGRGIKKSEYTEGVYFVTPKALEKLEEKYTCARYDIHSLNN